MATAFLISFDSHPFRQADPEFAEGSAPFGVFGSGRLMTCLRPIQKQASPASVGHRAACLVREGRICFFDVHKQGRQIHDSTGKASISNLLPLC
jgi:hypothetical protein